MVTPAAKRKAVSVMVTELRRSERQACRLTGLCRTTLRYRSRRPGEEELRQKLRQLAYERPRFGYRRLGIFLRRQGIRINDKKVLRLYRSEGLLLPRKRPRKRLFRRLRTLNVVDEFTRVCHAILVDTSIGGRRVVRLLDELEQTVGLPECIVIDNGTEFTSRAFLAWAAAKNVEPHFIDPGKPVQNCYVESFNGKFRDECLNAQWFLTLDDARRAIEEWRVDYNEVRPHSSLDERTPAEFAAAHGQEAA